MGGPHRAGSARGGGRSALVTTATLVTVALALGVVLGSSRASNVASGQLKAKDAEASTLARRLDEAQRQADEQRQANTELTVAVAESRDLARELAKRDRLIADLEAALAHARAQECPSCPPPIVEEDEEEEDAVPDAIVRASGEDGGNAEKACNDGPPPALDCSSCEATHEAKDLAKRFASSERKVAKLKGALEEIKEEFRRKCSNARMIWVSPRAPSQPPNPSTLPLIHV